jgi:hypothetical protein
MDKSVLVFFRHVTPRDVMSAAEDGPEKPDDLRSVPACDCIPKVVSRLNEAVVLNLLEHERIKVLARQRHRNLVESTTMLTREGNVTANPTPEVPGPLDRDVRSNGDAVGVIICRNQEVQGRHVERVGEREQLRDVEATLALLDLADPGMVDANAEGLHAGR